MFEFWNSHFGGWNIDRRCPERIRNVSEATTTWTPNGILNRFRACVPPETWKGLRPPRVGTLASGK